MNSVEANLATVVDGSATDAMSVDELQERRARQLRDGHRTMLCLAAFVVSAAFLLHIADDADHISLRGLSALSLPPLCGSRMLFGVDCPGCGLTRSFVALAGGDFARSYAFHHVGWVLALAVLAQFPYRVFALRELRTKVVERSWPMWCGYGLIALLIGNWLGKMAGVW